jgi:Flp pilus assembly protein TadG
MFAITSVSLLAVIGVLYSFGIVLAQRRGLQTAADAASLSGTWQLLSELQSDNRSDASVSARVVEFAIANGLPSGGAEHLAAEYVDASGASLVAVGSGAVPLAARGVRVNVTNQVPTVLPGFLRLTQLRVQASASAVARPTASPDEELRAMPVAARLDDVRAAYAGHASFDLFGGSSRMLDLRDAGAESWEAWPQNLQYWSDGQHQNGRVRVGDSLALTPEQRLDAVAAGLQDNVRRQGLVDGSGEAYALVAVPVWDTESSSPPPGSVRVAGFALLKLRRADITASSARGLFVPYATAAWAAQPVAGAGSDLGPVLIGLNS